MSFLYGAADEKFFKIFKEKKPVPGPLQSYKFFIHPYLRGREKFKKNDLPLIFKATPDTLLHLCIRVIDLMPLPPVFEWTELDICKWLRGMGFPQYQRTFRENLINGRTLLLVDASALQAMNIKRFDHIKRISYGIRLLFLFEMTKFARSISLPPQYYYEHYKLFRVKNGYKYESIRRSDLWRRMQLIREKSPNRSHWDVLERWLAFIKDPEFPELFGAVRRYQLYKCKKQPNLPPEPEPTTICNCMPPCTCYWTEDDIRKPWRFQILKEQDKVPVEPPFEEDIWKWDEPVGNLLLLPRTSEPHTITFLADKLPYKYKSENTSQSPGIHLSFSYNAIDESQRQSRPKQLRYSLLGTIIK